MISMLVLASPSAATTIDFDGYLAGLPDVDAPTLYCVWCADVAQASARVLIGEVLEVRGRYADAIRWVQPDVNVSAQ